MKKILLLLSLFFVNLFLFSQEGGIDLSKEYSMEYFQKGIRYFHDARYELSITNFLKSLSYKEDNHIAGYFLGEAYRKAGYNESALFVWNSLLAMGYEERGLKNRISYVYNKRGMLDKIFIDKEFILREDIKGVYDNKSLPLFIKPGQITVGKDNRYFITSFLTGSVAELDSNLDFVRNYVSIYPKLEKPYGVAIDKEGGLYVSDFKNDVVLKINEMNVVEKTIGFKGIGEGGLLGPKNIIFDDEDNLYVSDSGNKRINKYKKNGDFLFSFGTAKNDEGTLKSPSGIFYNNKKIYVADRDNNRIVIFDKNGNFISTFGEEKLDNPYDITMDNIGRFLIACKEKVWIYEEDNKLWYLMENIGSRLKRGNGIVSDRENNILITDFDLSRLLVLSLEKQRYSNLNINVERTYSQNFPNVHLAVTIEKEDGASPVGITAKNLSVYENGKYIPVIGTGWTEEKNRNSDITVIYDRTKTMVKHFKDFKAIMNKWLSEINERTNVSLISGFEDNPYIENEFGASRLSIIDSIDNKEYARFTDKGASIKYGIYNMLPRFSKKSIVIVTDGKGSGNDFEKFKVEDCVEFAVNNDIKIYVVAFGEGELTSIYRYITKKTSGDYYRAFQREDLQDLFKKIENEKGKEIIISYVSRTKSRFYEEPITVYVESNYNGMKGIGKTVYYPGK